MNEVINTQSFRDKLIEKIKNDFSDLIPKEDWDKLVNEVTTKFIEEEVPNIIKAELKTQVTDSFNIWVQSNVQWADKNSETFSEIIKQSAPALMEGFFKNMADNIAINITSNIRNGY